MRTKSPNRSEKYAPNAIIEAKINALCAIQTREPAVLSNKRARTTGRKQPSRRGSLSIAENSLRQSFPPRSQASEREKLIHQNQSGSISTWYVGEGHGIGSEANTLCSNSTIPKHSPFLFPRGDFGRGRNQQSFSTGRANVTLDTKKKNGNRKLRSPVVKDLPIVVPPLSRARRDTDNLPTQLAHTFFGKKSNGRQRPHTEV